MTAVGRFCCKSRKSNNPKNFARVDLWTSLLLHRFSAPLRRFVIDFGSTDCAKRISGSKTFPSTPQKDFCNKIGTLRTWREVSLESVMRLRADIAEDDFHR